MTKIHDCRITTPFNETTHSFADRYHEKIQDFSQKCFLNGWVLTSMLVPSFFSEPLQSGTSSFRRLVGWKNSWKKYGYDAGDPKSLEKLEKDLQASPSNLVPVLLFHGLFSTPDIWLPWAPKLKKAVDKKKIGPLITLQLPNDLTERMKVVDQAIENVVKIYRKVNIRTGQNNDVQEESDIERESDIQEETDIEKEGDVQEEDDVQEESDVQVDIIGHSKGGYAGHLAAFKEYTVKDELGVERRWHSKERNPQVRKVISIAASAWLCLEGQHDETTILDPKEEDIYPRKAVLLKDLKSAYTKEQIEDIQQSHEGIYDFIGIRDAITPIISPLPKDQVYFFKHGHLSVATCLKVCKEAIAILAQN